MHLLPSGCCITVTTVGRLFLAVQKCLHRGPLRFGLATARNLVRLDNQAGGDAVFETSPYCPFRATHRYRIARSNAFGEICGCRKSIVRELVDQPKFVTTLRRDEFAGKNQFGGATPAYQPRQPLRPTPAGKVAQRDLGLP